MAATRRMCREDSGTAVWRACTGPVDSTDRADDPQVCGKGYVNRKGLQEHCKKLGYTNTPHKEQAQKDYPHLWEKWFKSKECPDWLPPPAVEKADQYVCSAGTPLI